MRVLAESCWKGRNVVRERCFLLASAFRVLPVMQHFGKHEVCLHCVAFFSRERMYILHVALIVQQEPPSGPCK